MAIKRDFKLTDDLKEDLFEGERVEEESWRHGTRIAIVFEADGAHWLTWIDTLPEEGWQFYGDTIEAEKVELREVTLKKWVAV